MVDEAFRVKVEEVTEVLTPMVLALRELGLDAKLFLDPKGDHVSVEIHVRVPGLGIPIEYKGN